MLDTRRSTPTLALALALALAGLALLPLAGCMGGGGGQGKIVIIYHEEFDGLEVEIDGKVVGKLKKFGENPRTAFLVSKGDHTIRVLHPTLASTPEKVTAVSKAVPVTLLLEVGEGTSADGRFASSLVLRR
jgi:hypothetical protein